jgi:hypothetical protein
MASRKRIREIERQLRKANLEAYKNMQARGAAIYRRLSELEQSGDRTRIGQEVMVLLKEAKSQLNEISKSIHEKTKYDSDPGEPLDEGDSATAFAEDIAGVMREYTCNPQTLWQASSGQLPDVQFTVDWHDATSMTAAWLRLERITGFIEGLEFAGVPVPKSKS